MCMENQEENNNLHTGENVLKIVFVVLILLMLPGFIVILMGFYKKLEQKIVTKKHTTTDYMLDYRHGYTATQLKDGRILIIGGSDKAPEIYDPKTRKSTYTNQTNIYRGYEPSSILLNDGTVLVVGGLSNNTPTKNKAERYDPKTGKFKIVANTNFCEITTDISLTKLQNGDVFILCTRYGAIYSPQKGIVKIAPEIPFFTSDVATTLLPDGKVMIVGFFPRSFKRLPIKDTTITNINAKEYKNLNAYTTLIYNPESNNYVVGPQMTSKRIKIKALDGKDDQKIFFGGYRGRFDMGEIGEVNLIEEFNPKTRMFKKIGKLNETRNPYSGVVLPNGKIFFYANNVKRSVYHPFRLKDQIEKYTNTTHPTCELFDPSTGESHYTKICADIFKYGSKYFVQPDGKLIIVGGVSPWSMKKQEREIITIDTKEVK